MRQNKHHSIYSNTWLNNTKYIFQLLKGGMLKQKPRKWVSEFDPLRLKHGSQKSGEFTRVIQVNGVE